MARERLRKRREAALEVEEQLLREAHGRNELSDLHGRPLDLSDDSPNWFMNRLLRREGVSHPLIERGRDVDEAIEEVWRILEPVRQRYSRLEVPESEVSAREADLFNLRREQALDEVRRRLPELNRLIRDHNLTVPDALHRRPFLLVETMERIESEIPAIEAHTPAAPRHPRGWGRRISRIIGRRGD